MDVNWLALSISSHYSSNIFFFFSSFSQHTYSIHERNPNTALGDDNIRNEVRVTSFVNQDLVREIALLKEGVYGRGSSVLDMHVMLPSHIVEKKRLVRRHAMYHDIPYQVELRYYTDQQQKVENWLNAIDVT
jgi:hypothetical protein